MTYTPRPATHCRNGHEYTPENTRIGSTGKRRCMTCYRAAQARRPKPDPATVAANRRAAHNRAAATRAAQQAAHDAAVIEDAEFLIAHGEHGDRIAARLGYKRESLQKLFRRNGRHDLSDFTTTPQETHA